MPNISETVQETFTKLSGFFGVIPVILCAKYGGDLAAQFLGKRWESYIFKMGGTGESKFFVQLGAFEYSKIKS